MQLKDLNIVEQTAKEYDIALPTTAVNTQLFNAMVQNGMADLDNSAVIAMIEMLSNEKLVED